MMRFARKKLARRMEDLDILPAELASQMGVRTECIRAWIRGDRNPTLEHLKGAAYLLDCSETDLMEDADEE